MLVHMCGKMSHPPLVPNVCLKSGITYNQHLNRAGIHLRKYSMFSEALQHSLLDMVMIHMSMHV